MKIELNTKQSEFLQELLTAKESLEKRISDIILFAVQGYDIDFNQIIGVKLENNKLLINLKEDGTI
mgnify:CR=1 FL=1